jgi:hypothetical protein
LGGPREDEFAHLIDVSGAEFVVTDQKTHIDRTVKDVQYQVEVEATGEFTAVDSTKKRFVGFLPSRSQEAGAESLQ